MKKLLGVFIALTLAFTLAACQEPEAETSYLAVDINPGVEFILDEDGNVVSIQLLNEDAEIVAADLELEGLSYEAALEEFLDAAIDTGYIDVDSDENIVTVTADDEAVQEEHKADVEAILSERGVGAAIFGGTMDEEYVNLAEEHDISVGRARLIARAVEIDGDLTFASALDLEHSEIMTILIDAHREKMDEFIEERQSEAQAMKEEMRDMAQERVDAHREKVENNEIATPDYDTIRDDAENNMNAIRSAYEERIKNHHDEAHQRREEANTEHSYNNTPLTLFLA